MAEISYNIAALLQEAFSAAPIFRYNIPDVSQGRPSIDFTEVEVGDIEKGDMTSYLGTPIMFPIKLEGGNYLRYQDGQLEAQEYEEIDLPYTAIADFDRSKNMSETKLNASYGTAKEIYGFDDWRISIRGLIISENPLTFPEDQLRKLKEYEEIVDSIGVQGRLFQILGINNIVIKRISLESMVGKPNVRSFRIMAMSDEPQEFLIDDQ
jgi:hypothetical protein